MRSLVMKLTVFAAVAMLTAPAFAQTDTYGAKADIVMELRPSKIIESPLGIKLNLAKQVEDIAATAPADQPNLSNIARILAGMVAPTNTDAIKELQKGTGKDMQFFVRLEFTTAEAAKQIVTKAIAGKSGEIQKNGRTYYKLPETTKGFPEGTVSYQVSEKVVELASEGFAFRTETELPFTDGLMAAWNAMPDEALKISVDGVNARALLTSMVNDSKKQFQGNPLAGAIMGLFPTMDNINLSIDLNSANLLTLKMVGADEEKAADINDAFKSLMTLTKPLAKQGLVMIEPKVPQSAAVFGKLVDDMDVTQQGKTVTLHIPRTEGFEDATTEAMPVVQELMNQMTAQAQKARQKARPRVVPARRPRSNVPRGIPYRPLDTVPRVVPAKPPTGGVPNAAPVPKLIPVQPPSAVPSVVPSQPSVPVQPQT